jgi:hypothetical protein
MAAMTEIPFTRARSDSLCELTVAHEPFSGLAVTALAAVACEVAVADLLGELATDRRRA